MTFSFVKGNIANGPISKKNTDLDQLLKNQHLLPIAYKFKS